MADIRVAPGEPALATPGFGTLLDSWRQIIATGNLPKGRAMDGVSRWLLITRACVFSMTLTSGLIGGLLAAATAAAPRWGYFALALLGLVIAHAANNMINDYFDLAGGVDTAEYTRALYAPHPILSGLISKRGLLAAIAAVVLGLVVSGYLGVGVLIVAAALPRLRQVLRAYAQPKPAAPPPGYRVWPLWYVSLAFYHNKLAGGLFVLGLALNAVFRL